MPRPTAKAPGLKFDESFEQISQAPVVQDAIRKAMVSAKNDAAKLGFTPPKNPFQFDETGRLKLKTEDGSTMTPNLQFWDIVKRNLDKTGTPEARDWARILREHLDDMVPSYNTARAGAAKFFGAGDALEAGQNFRRRQPEVRHSGGAQAAREDVGGEKQLFQDGYVSRLVETIEKTGDRRTVLNKISASPAAREEMNVALGRERAGEVEARLRIEGIMDLARPAVQGNSTTARQLVELGLAGGVGGYEGYPGRSAGDDEGSAGLWRGARPSGDRRAGRATGREATDLERCAAAAEGDRLISRNQNMMGAIRNADAGLAAIAARGAAPTGSRELGAQ
jgi:hypothetical protein